MISTRVVCRPFIGRVAELQHLASRRRRAGDGHGGIVLIGGEAGIGKSRLVAHFLQHVNRRTSIVATGACREFAQTPLGPIIDVIEQIGTARGELVFATKSERLDAIANAFERNAAKRSTVAVVEDLQWASVDMMQTLLILARRATTTRLLIVATYRDDELTAGHPLFKWFGQLVREPATSVVTLERFQAPEMDRLMAHAVEERTALAAPILRAVRTRSDGNPLFAEELLRSALDSERSGRSSSAAALPLSLHAIVADRLQACSEEERTVLRQASLFGRNFRIGRVREVFGGETSAFVSALERLSDLQMVDAVDRSAGDYRFRHALTRDVVYGEIPQTTRAALHLVIGEYFARLEGAEPEPEVLGHHFWEAGDHARAAAHYQRAGDAAMAVFAYDDAAAYYQRAAAGFDAEHAARASSSASAGRALVFAGDLEGGLTLYERAVTLMCRLENFAEVVRYRVLMAGHMFDGGRRSEAVELLRATLPFAERGDAPLRVALQTRLAMMLARSELPDQARSVLQAIDARDLDSAGGSAAEYHLGASELAARAGDLAAWRECFASGTAVFERLGHPGPLHIAHANFAIQSLWIGEMELARSHYRIANDLARTLQFDDQTIMQAQVELYAGNLAQTRRIVEAAPPSSRFVVRATRAQIALPLAVALGDNQLLAQNLDETLMLDARAKSLTATHARIAAAHALALDAMSRRSDARELLERAITSLTTTFGMALVFYAIAVLLPERSVQLLPLFRDAARLQGDRVNKALLALLAAAAQERESAGAGTKNALDGANLFSAIGWPLFEARCLEIAGEWRAARAIYVRCGAAGDVRRLEFGTTGSQESALGVLTPRERELALEVAAGKTNRAVAHSLSIGEKAVEKYLTSIYSKLGLTSRSQLAALVAASQNRAP